jgi:indole-3-glycerol phosphate synthase
MNTLSNILEHKQKEVEERKSLFPVKFLERSLFFESTPVSLKKYVTREDKEGIIAEIKRKSPSKGPINPYISVERTSIGYMQAGASALSVLTDEVFFGGSSEDLRVARKFNFCPILRKDFIIDEYQILEAKSIGADAILFIAAVLNTSRLKSFTEVAHNLGMEVLLEVHDQNELEGNLDIDVDLLGVNNRNLKTFDVDVNISKELAKLIPSSRVSISESGLGDVPTILELRKYGYKGFLIGEQFMRQSRPEDACKEFIDQIKITSRVPGTL